MKSNPFTSQSSLSNTTDSYNARTPATRVDKESINKSYESVQKDEESPSQVSPVRYSPHLSPDRLLGDISFLHQFKDKMVSKTPDKGDERPKDGGGRYSLLDRNMEPVDKGSHVITQLWKLPTEKNMNCLLGQMESCEAEVVIGEEPDAPLGSSSHSYLIKPVVKAGRKKINQTCFSFYIFRLQRLSCNYSEY